MLLAEELNTHHKFSHLNHLSMFKDLIKVRCVPRNPLLVCRNILSFISNFVHRFLPSINLSMSGWISQS